MAQPRMRITIAWFFIIAGIVFTQFTIYSRTDNELLKASVQNLQIQVNGKYIIGVMQLIGQNPAFEKRFSKLKRETQKIQGNRMHLSSIPIIAELSGKKAALQELNKMSENPDMVVDAGNLPLFRQIYEKGSASLDSKQLKALKRYGWIGKLALSQDKPDSDPERQAVLRSATRMVVFVGLFTMALLASLLGGLVLLIIAIVLYIKGRLHGSVMIPENSGSSLLESFAVYLVGWGVLPALIVMIAPDIRIAAILLGVAAVIISLMWPRLRGMAWKDYRPALGWNLGKGFFREVGSGIVGFITGLPLLAAAIVVVVIMIRHTGASPSHPIINMLGQNPVYLFLLACVWAPLTEESLFRGALFGHLRKSLSWATSGIIVGLIFAVLHPQGWVTIPVLAVVGFNLCAIREWRGSIIASMTAHALHNGAAVLMLVLAL